MSAEGRALASGALEKELGSGHWRKSENRCGSECSQSSYCRSAKEVSLECRRTVLCYQRAFVGVAVKPVGKPDALVGHVRFDERVVSRTRREARCCTKDEGGSSESPCGRRLQTAGSCFGQKPRW